MDEVSWSTVSEEGLSEALIRISGVYEIDRPKLSALLLEAGRRIKSYEVVEEKLEEGWYESSHFPVSPKNGFNPYYVDGEGKIFLMDSKGSRYPAESTTYGELIPLGRDV